MTEKILQHLGIRKSVPTVGYLQELITAYCSQVPWESVSKIVRKALYKNPKDCVRLENEFWAAAFQLGTGGTCYETNWAFFSLLQRLGFEGYLTINKIMDKSSVHSAIVIVIEGKKYIVDVGYPTYAPIAVAEHSVAITVHDLFQYRSTPVSSKEYLIENFPHPKPYLYHLTDTPVPPDEYLKIASDDYGAAGLFSDRIVIRKLINKVPTRFDSENIPYNIHTLQNGQKLKTLMEGKDITGQLGDHFALDHNLIRQAFVMLNKTNAQQGESWTTQKEFKNGFVEQRH